MHCSSGIATLQGALVKWRRVCLLVNRLERGRFVWPRTTYGTFILGPAQLSVLLKRVDRRLPHTIAEPILRMPSFHAAFFALVRRFHDTHQLCRSFSVRILNAPRSGVPPLSFTSSDLSQQSAKLAEQKRLSQFGRLKGQLVTHNNLLARDPSPAEHTTCACPLCDQQLLTVSAEWACRDLLALDERLCNWTCVAHLKVAKKGSM